MAVKTTVAEWKKFYADPGFWPDSAWHDDAQIAVDGVVLDDVDFKLHEDSAVVVVSGGVVFIIKCSGQNHRL